MQKRSLALFTTMLLLFSGTAQAGFSDWMRGWHLELHGSTFPRVSQAENPLTLRQSDYYGNVIREIGTIHDFPVNLDPVFCLGITGEIPMLKADSLTLGLRLEEQWPFGIAGGKVVAWGVYVSAPFNKVTAKAWYGAKDYYFNSGDLYLYDGVRYSGTDSATTMGLGARFDIKAPFTLGASIESTGEAEIRPYSYQTKYGNIYPPLGYSIPPVRIHRNTTLRLEVGMDFSFLPASADLQEARDKRYEDKINNILNDNLPVAYVPFARDLAIRIDKQPVSYGSFGYNAANVISWQPDQQRLVMQVKSGKRYQVSEFYDEWIKTHNVLDDIYPKLKVDYIAHLTQLIAEVSKAHLADIGQSPVRMTLQVEFGTHTIVMTSQSVRSGFITTISSSPTETDQRTHVANVDIVIDPSAADLVRIESYSLIPE